VRRMSSKRIASTRAFQLAAMTLSETPTVDQVERTAADGAWGHVMSKEGYGGDSSPHWPSHLMFFFTDAYRASWGANLPGSPVVGVNDPVEHLPQFVLTVQQWSDGTQAGEAAGIIISIYTPTGPLRTRETRTMTPKPAAGLPTEVVTRPGAFRSADASPSSTDFARSRSGTGMHINLILLSVSCPISAQGEPS